MYRYLLTISKNYLKHKESAFICSPNNVLEFAENMEYVANNPENAILVGEKGKLICKENFDNFQKEGIKIETVLSK